MLILIIDTMCVVYICMSCGNSLCLRMPVNKREKGIVPDLPYNYMISCPRNVLDTLSRCPSDMHGGHFHWTDSPLLDVLYASWWPSVRARTCSWVGQWLALRDRCVSCAFYLSWYGRYMPNARDISNKQKKSHGMRRSVHRSDISFPLQHALWSPSFPPCSPLCLTRCRLWFFSWDMKNCYWMKTCRLDPHCDSLDALTISWTWRTLRTATGV